MEAIRYEVRDADRVMIANGDELLVVEGSIETDDLRAQAALEAHPNIHRAVEGESVEDGDSREEGAEAKSGEGARRPTRKGAN